MRRLALALLAALALAPACTPAQEMDDADGSDAGPAIDGGVDGRGFDADGGVTGMFQPYPEDAGKRCCCCK